MWNPSDNGICTIFYDQLGNDANVESQMDKTHKSHTNRLTPQHIRMANCY